jgi:N-acetylglucosamine kinase-like BadF-type ATPase
VQVVRDIDLVVGQLDGPGAALIVGTGAVALVPTDNSETLVDGRGFPVGDWGGGAWIGLEALRRGLRHHDHTGTASNLLAALCVELGLPTDRGVLAALQEDGALTAQRLARLAPTVLQLAAAGDEQANGVTSDAVAALRDTVLWALRRGGFAGPAHVVAAGGLMQPGPFRDHLAHSLATSGAVAQLRFVDPLDAPCVSS